MNREYVVLSMDGKRCGCSKCGSWMEADKDVIKKHLIDEGLDLARAAEQASGELMADPRMVLREGDTVYHLLVENGNPVIIRNQAVCSQDGPRFKLDWKDVGRMGIPFGREPHVFGNEEEVKTGSLEKLFFGEGGFDLDLDLQAIRERDPQVAEWAEELETCKVLMDAVAAGTRAVNANLLWFLALELNCWKGALHRWEAASRGYGLRGTKMYPDAAEERMCQYKADLEKKPSRMRKFREIFLEKQEATNGLGIL